MPSSVVSAIKYDAPNSTLRVIYQSGMIYDYKEVPEEVYMEMKNSKSKGIYLNKQIKARYSFEKVNSDEH